jgi:hypothetical protein
MRLSVAGREHNLSGILDSVAPSSPQHHNDFEDRFSETKVNRNSSIKPKVVEPIL